MSGDDRYLYWFISHLLETEFWEPSLPRAIDLIDMAQNIVHFRLYGIPVTCELLESMAVLRSLHTVEFCMCAVPWPIPRLKFPSVVNVRLANHSVPFLPQWSLLALFPHARTLSVYSPPEWRLWFEDAVPATMIGIESLYLHECANVDPLAHWLRTATQTGPLRLTHLAFRPCSITEADVRDLVTALSLAPITMLNLGGLQFISRNLFAQLAATLPMLESLTITLSKHDVGFWLYPPTWEVASWTSMFPRLTHFGFDPPLASEAVAPAILTRFEDDFTVVSPDDEDDELPDECHSLVRLFGIHAPKLQTVVLLGDQNDRCFDIIRRYGHIEAVERM
jgi:hypothetical protein